MSSPCTATVHSRMSPTEPCQHCRHTNLVHRGHHNPDLDACLLCQIELLLPARQDPREPISPAGVPPVLVHHVVVDKQPVHATFDPIAANERARRMQGVVTQTVVYADYRQAEPAEED